MLYLQLLHGRSTPDEQLDNWGFTAPLLGPFSWFHVTYMTDFNFGVAHTALERFCLERLGFSLFDDGVVQLKVNRDLVTVGGDHYGDWELVTVDSPNQRGASLPRIPEAVIADWTVFLASPHLRSNR